ncbi:MAG TPA: flavin reductase family protein [bacterium]|nr:flavin reductase family protein [bacterium]HPQ65691.1 flavin reductase family protein [bacterium]
MKYQKIEVLDKVAKVVYLVQPSPVVLVSTVDTAGVKNLAPYAMFTPCSTCPPMVALGISPKSDTFKNISKTGEFVVGIPTSKILTQLYQAANEYPPAVDEFEETGLTPYARNKVKPARIAECAVNLECKLQWHKEAGNHHVVVGLVVAADIDKELFSEDKIKLRSAIPQVYHLTSGTFLVDGKVIDVKH